MDLRWNALSKEQIAKKLRLPKFFRFTATGTKSEGCGDQLESILHSFPALEKDRVSTFPAFKHLLHFYFFKF